MEVVFVRVAEAQNIVGLGRSKLLELAYRGDIPSVKVGRSRLFPVAGLHAWAEGMQVASGGAPSADQQQEGIEDRGEKRRQP
jgi:excisionase family DNA binding protein